MGRYRIYKRRRNRWAECEGYCQWEEKPRAVCKSCGHVHVSTGEDWRAYFRECHLKTCDGKLWVMQSGQDSEHMEGLIELDSDRRRNVMLAREVARKLSS